MRMARALIVASLLISPRFILAVDMTPSSTAPGFRSDPDDSARPAVPTRPAPLLLPPGLAPAAPPVDNNPFGTLTQTELMAAYNLRDEANKTHEKLIRDLDTEMASLKNEIAAKEAELAAATTDADKKRLTEQIASRKNFLSEYQRDRMANVAAIAENNMEMELIKKAFQKFLPPLVDPRPTPNRP